MDDWSRNKASSLIRHKIPRTSSDDYPPPKLHRLPNNRSICRGNGACLLPNSELRSRRSRKQPPALLSRNRIGLPWPMVPITIDEASRKWNEMDHDILVLIMKKLGNLSNLHYRSFFFCKSWMSAVLDSVFPPGNVLDLRPLTLISRDQRPYFLFFLKVLLSRPHQYTKLFFPEYCFTSRTGTCIAQRLPALKCLVAQKSPGDYVHADLLPYWPELNEAICRASLILSLGQHCTNIRRLDPYRRI